MHLLLFRSIPFASLLCERIRKTKYTLEMCAYHATSIFSCAYTFDVNNGFWVFFQSRAYVCVLCIMDVVCMSGVQRTAYMKSSEKKLLDVRAANIGYFYRYFDLYSILYFQNFRLLLCECDVPVWTIQLINLLSSSYLLDRSLFVQQMKIQNCRRKPGKTYLFFFWKSAIPLA